MRCHVHLHCRLWHSLLGPQTEGFLAKGGPYGRSDMKGSPSAGHLRATGDSPLREHPLPMREHPLTE